MKYLILVAIIYGIYRFTQPKKPLMRGSNHLDKEEDDGEYTEYEEVD
ncbi:MAG: hypothetical protein P1U56_00645 [Saprospiraceae bacterium]|nr:hypothetical protein [Saprospiraceae bacterium]